MKRIWIPIPTPPGRPENAATSYPLRPPWIIARQGDESKLKDQEWTFLVHTGWEVSDIFIIPFAASVWQRGADGKAEMVAHWWDCSD